MALGKGKTTETQKINSCQKLGWGWGKYEQLEHGGFLEQWTTSDDTIMLDIWHYTFVQTHRI